MIGISKLYCGTVEPSDVLRYGRGKPVPSHLLQFRRDARPVVVWNVTRACNLRCVHCYAAASGGADPDELTTSEGLALLDDLAGFGVPVVLFSGGEPLMRPDLLALVGRATERGMRAVISTNGTLIDEAAAGRLAEAGLAYVGISLDGVGAVNDRFRGVEGAYSRALEGLRRARDAGIKVGLRVTLTRRNADQVDPLFDLLERERIPRVCFYHLVYAGRGSALMAEDLSHEATRAVLDRIIDRTASLHAAGHPAEVLTVDNHADGPYLYMRMEREGDERAGAVLDLLRMNGGNASGQRIGCVSWDGRVHPDQFWRHVTVGNVRERPFSAIWTDPAVELLASLRDRKARLTGRCAACRFLDACNGNFRVRAEAATGDLWAPDPACYLTDAEIGIGPTEDEA